MKQVTKTHKHRLNFKNLIIQNKPKLLLTTKMTQ